MVSRRYSTGCSLPSQMPKQLANCDQSAFAGQSSSVRPATLFAADKTKSSRRRFRSQPSLLSIDHQQTAFILLNSLQLSGLFPFSESDRSTVENAPSNYIDCMPEFSEFFQSAPAPYTLNDPNKVSMMSTAAPTNVSNTSPAIAPSFIDGKSVSSGTHCHSQCKRSKLAKLQVIKPISFD